MSGANVILAASVRGRRLSLTGGESSYQGGVFARMSDAFIDLARRHGRRDLKTAIRPKAYRLQPNPIRSAIKKSPSRCVKMAISSTHRSTLKKGAKCASAAARTITRSSAPNRRVSVK